MVLSSNNSLFFFSDFEIIFFFALESFHTFDIFRPNPRYSIFFFCSRNVCRRMIFSGVVQRRVAKTKKRKKMDKKIQSRARTEKKSKWDLMHHLFSFSGDEIQIKRSIWRQRDLIKPSGICIQLGFSSKLNPHQGQRPSNDKMVITI